MDREEIYNMVDELEELIHPDAPYYETICNKIEEIKQKLQE